MYVAIVHCRQISTSLYPHHHDHHTDKDTRSQIQLVQSHDVFMNQDSAKCYSISMQSTLASKRPSHAPVA